MVGAMATQPGPRMTGAFMANVQSLLTSPAPGGVNTSTTVSLQAKNLDPFRRTGTVIFDLDRSGAFGSDMEQISSAVSVLGWADVAASWVSAVIANGAWYYRARSSLVHVGAGPSVPNGRYTAAVQFRQDGGEGVFRALYLYENRGIESRIAAVGSNDRDLYLYVNRGIEARVAGVGSNIRALYLYVNRGHYAVVLERSLYVYRNTRDTEVFPYLNSISPDEQYVGGQVSLIGDGFGQYLEARASATLSVSSTNGGNAAANVRDDTSNEWQSTSGAAAWIRFTWGGAKRIVAVVLEGSRLAATTWGIPRFTFDDASQQDGAVAVDVPGTGSAEYPVGQYRQAFWLATPKVSTYVEVAIASGGSGTNRGFSEVWVIEEASPAQNAETARAVLNRTLGTELSMGIVSWLNRSPNWWPANSGVPPLAAVVVTVPTGAVSGLVNVEETT